MALNDALDINSLPSEVLAQIFGLCLPPDLESSIPDPGIAPLLMLPVCRFWRSTALEHPRLWTSLRLYRGLLGSSSTTPTTERWMSCVLFWLRLSGSLPISFSVSLHTIVDPTPGNACLFMSDWDIFVESVLVRHAHRFRVLELKFDSINYISPFLALSGSSIAHLESIYLQGPELLSGKAALSSIFGSATRLQRVVIHRDKFRPTINRMPLSFFPWSQLTHLMINRRLSILDCHSVLNLCKSLRVCIINVLGYASNTSFLPLAQFHIPLVHLIELDITFQEVTNQFFDNLYFPHLTKLVMCANTRTSLPSSPAEIISQSHLFHQLLNVQSLTLTNLNIPDSTLLNLLQLTGNLVELTLDNDVADYNHFLRSMSYRPDQLQACLLPRLDTLNLYVEYYSETRFSTNTFLDMVTSRCSSSASPSSTAKLKNVALYLPHHHSSDAMDIQAEIEHREMSKFGVNFDIQAEGSVEDWLKQSPPFWD